MHLEEASVRYVYKDFAIGVMPTLDDVKALDSSWDDEYAEAPFCNDGEFNIEDLKEEASDSWSFNEIGQLDEGQCRIAIFSFCYGGEGHVNLQVSDVELKVFNACGIRVLSGGDKHEEIFGEEWYSEEIHGEKVVHLMYKFPNLNCDPEVYAHSLYGIEDQFDEWIESLKNPPSQEELDSRAALLKSLFG